LNAYIACCHLGSDHTPAFLICRNCRAVGEANASQVEIRLDAAAQAVGFVIERTVVEAEGLCPNCQDAA
jgi:Fur family zinc uptake transcriptional regulator